MGEALSQSPQIVLLGPVSAALQDRQGVLDLLADPGAKNLHRGLIHRFRGESGVIGGFGEGRMHLGETAAKDAGERHVGGEVRGRLGVSGDDQVVDHPGQIVRGPGPAVALAVDEGLGDHQGMRRPISVDAAHLADKGRHMGIAPLAEHPCHLGFGMHAWHDLAEQLEHDLAADDHRAVALLGRGPFDFGVIACGEGG